MHMKAILRHEIIIYRKKPFFWIILAAVAIGIFQEVQPFLEIHYVTKEEAAAFASSDPSADEVEIYEGYIPTTKEQQRALWDKEIRQNLVSGYGISEDEADSVIRKMDQMDVEEASQYLEENYSYYDAYDLWPVCAYRKGSSQEINAYIKSQLSQHPFSYYFSKEFANFASLFMGFGALLLLSMLFIQDMRKNTYELLHTKPVSTAGYVLGKALGGFFVCLIALGILDILFWLLCLLFTKGNGYGFETVRLSDFLSATCLYLLPNMLMVASVYTFVSLCFKNPVPAIPLLFAYMTYSCLPRKALGGGTGDFGNPLSLIVRFPQKFFQLAPPDGVWRNQVFLLAASALLLLLSTVLWGRRRI